MQAPETADGSSPAAPSFADALRVWLRIGLLSFGRPGTEGNRFAIEQGIKKRDSGECMKDFIDDIRPAVRDAGLLFPEPAALRMELPADIDWSV